MMNGMGSFGFGGMGFGWVFWIILLGVIIWAVIKITNNNRSPYNIHHFAGGEALDILKKRYANGEITKEQFADMRRDLQIK